MEISFKDYGPESEGVYSFRITLTDEHDLATKFDISVVVLSLTPVIVEEEATIPEPEPAIQEVKGAPP